MTESSQLPVMNRLIAGLPLTERNALQNYCVPVELAFGDVLCTQHERYTHAYFPSTAIISLMASVKGHPPMELGMIGHEGMLGVSLLLAVDLAPQRAIVQGPGTALQITKRGLRDLLPDSPVLHKSLQRYFFRLMTQTLQTTVCTCFHLVDARLVRWLLMTHDRAHADDFHLTHQFLADMLGVQRSAVTIASGILKDHGLIEYSRGKITILDRAGLEAAACDCYAAERFTIAD
ncbi:MAG: Crp/Fnr family transcriptional regulator [Pseudomonadales bacterium]